jgi:hypothetical protein
MGKIYTSRDRPPQIAPIAVSRDLKLRLEAAARRMEQPVAAWVRLAIIEKLERDAAS